MDKPPNIVMTTTRGSPRSMWKSRSHCRIKAHLTTHIQESHQHPIHPHEHQPRRHLVHDCPTVRTAIDLHRRPHRQSHTTASKQRCTGSTIPTQIKVHIRSILIRILQRTLRTQRVSISRTQIVDHDHNAITSIRQRIARRVSPQR